jgi:catechol 2,3-dioxygenase-like lactoylglutathione lyase family enzyme
MEFALTHVRYVALKVADLAAEADFFAKDWLLDDVGEADAPVRFFAGEGSSEPYLLRLGEGPARSLELVALAARDRDAVDRLHARLVAKGQRVIGAPGALAQPGGGYGFRFFDLDGRVIEISSDVAQRSLPGGPVPEGVPLEISHVVLHTPDPEAAANYYGEMLGFKVADWLDRRMCFLRTGPKHHCLAFLTGAPSLNHIAFDLGTTNSVMRGVGRLMRSERRPKWGPGRHTAGDNTFAYFLTPSGNMMEYTAELETVPDDWTPTTYAMSAEVADQWGTGTLAGPFTPHVSQADPGLWSVPSF